MVAREKELRSRPKDAFFPGFDESVGHFWGLIDTRDYMRARCELVLQLIKCGPLASFELALKGCMDCLRLCRSDNLGMRMLIPELFLRLEKFQECYDFSIDRSDYDFGDLKLPFMNIKNANVFENFDWGKSTILNHLSAAAFIKLRLIECVREMSTVEQYLTEKFPFSVDRTKAIQLLTSKNQPMAPLLQHLPKRPTQDVIDDLSNQVIAIFKSAHKHNKHYWKMLTEYKKHDIPEPPESYVIGETSEALTAIYGMKQPWATNPQTLAEIKKLVAMQ
ncbi:hypothetical protein HDU97_008964 [Phlyctochytrium planicorne]|nr:hypothetical protein HDU97_008964 [Phlyctochytrium planicorne]